MILLECWIFTSKARIWFIQFPVVMFPNKNHKYISLYLKGLKGSSFCVLAGSRVNFVRERGFDVFSSGSDILVEKKNNYLTLHWCGALCSVWSSSSSLRVQSSQVRTDITFNFLRKGRGNSDKSKLGALFNLQKNNLKMRISPSRRSAETKLLNQRCLMISHI